MKKIYICPICGRFSEDKHGKKASRGWDISCSLNAILIDKDKLIWNKNHTRVIKILNGDKND